MKIALLSTVIESVPPARYGGTERVVGNLAKGLTDLGHDVTVYASADSEVPCRLRPVCDKSLRSIDYPIRPQAVHMAMAEIIVKEARQYDLIHSHLEHIAFPALRRLKVPHLSTMHNRVDTPEMDLLLREFSDIPLTALSTAQRSFAPYGNWKATIPHGHDADTYVVGSGDGGYLLFLGRICKEKGPDRAIEIAEAAGMPLKIAAKIDPQFRDYFDTLVKPRLTDTIEYLGEVNETQKISLLGGAKALLFPIEWPEPFGLVLTEAMACGTPVIAYPHGSVPEIIETGLNGFVVEDINGAVDAIEQCDHLSRQAIRSSFEARYTTQKMAASYAMLYSEMCFSAGGFRLPEVVPQTVLARRRSRVISGGLTAAPPVTSINDSYSPIQVANVRSD